LVDRLFDDGFDPAIKTFGAGGMAAGQEIGDGFAANPHLAQERPDAARRHPERFGHGGDIGRCSGPIGHAHNQVAPPCRHCPTGIVVARLVYDACQAASQLPIARQRDPQRVGRDLFTCVRAKQHRFGTQYALHPPASAGVHHLSADAERQSHLGSTTEAPRGTYAAC
jgi:hypothetical protein